jgi:hypothetical protein
MIKTTLPAKRAVAQIVEEYRVLSGSSAKQATLRAFAGNLSDALVAMGRKVSYQSVKNWQDRRYLPDGYLMLRLAQAGSHDWRGEFASDILAAIYPDSYEPATEIGRRAINTHKNALTMNGKHGNGYKNGNGNLKK